MSSCLDTVMEQISYVDECIRNSFDEHEEAQLRATKQDLLSRVSSVSSADSITFANGLKFIRMKLDNDSPEAHAALRMTKKLLQLASKVAVAIPIEHPPTKKQKKSAAAKVAPEEKSDTQACTVPVMEI